MFKDQNAFTLSPVSVMALGAGAGAVLAASLSGIAAGLALHSPLAAVLSSLFLTAQLYLALHVTFAALDAVAPKPFLRPVAVPPGIAPPIADVFISFDDPDDLEKAAFSLAAAARLKYPAERLRLHVVAAGRAADVSRPLEDLAHSYGASWFPLSMTPLREKALSQAFDRTAGQLVLFLKAGEAPQADLLERMAGAFVSDALLGVVEIGHFLVDGDGARAGTANARRLPADTGPMARAILRGGPRPSPITPVSALWRRGALITAGGFAHGADGEAAARLIAAQRGWDRQIVPFPMIATFAPQTISAALSDQAQRRLTALGVALNLGAAAFSRPHLGQIFKTLTLVTGAFAPFATFILLAAPALAVLLGARLWGGELASFAVYAPLGVLATLGLSAAAQSGWRHSAPSLFLDAAAQFVLLGPLAVLIAGGKPIVRAGSIFAPLTLAALSLAALGFGGARLAASPGLATGLLPLLALCCVTLAMSLGALGAVHEPRQKRAAPRLPTDMEAELLAGSQRIPGRLADISIQGARFVADHADPLGISVVGGVIRIFGPHGPINLPVQLSRAAPEQGRVAFGMRFTGRQLITFANAVTLVYRSQERFARERDLRGQSPNGVWTALRTWGNGIRSLLSLGRAQAA